MTECLNTYLYQLVYGMDDAKLMKVIKNQSDCQELQKDIYKIHAWRQSWKLKFNTQRSVMEGDGKT